MSQKHLVCQGATCQCQFGNAPDKLKVLTQTKAFINEEEPQEKLVATTADVGATFEKNTFGLCQMQPLPGGGYKPCQAMVTQWSGAYENVTYEENNGHPLLEDSKATCPIGGKDCISIINHGQVAEITEQNIRNARQEVINILFPLMQLEENDNFVKTRTPCIKKAYFTDERGKRISEKNFRLNDSLCLEMTGNYLKDEVVNIELPNDTVDFQHDEKILEEKILRDYKLKADRDKIILKIVRLQPTAVVTAIITLKSTNQQLTAELKQSEWDTETMDLPQRIFQRGEYDCVPTMAQIAANYLGFSNPNFREDQDKRKDSGLSALNSIGYLTTIGFDVKAFLDNPNDPYFAKGIPDKKKKEAIQFIVESLQNNKPVYLCFADEEMQEKGMGHAILVTAIRYKLDFSTFGYIEFRDPRRDKNGEGVLSSFNSSQSKVYMILALSRKTNDLNNTSEK